MIASTEQVAARTMRPGTLAGYGALAALIYFVLIGGGSQGELQPVPRMVSGVFAAALIGTYLWTASERADRMDRGVLLAVLPFTGAALLSQFPRQSIDAALGALALAAGLFVARDLLVQDSWRRLLLWAFIGLSAVLTLVSVARWMPIVISWQSVTGTLIPPLNLELPATPWGHRYDLALVIALMYPAWWMGRPSPMRRTAAVVVGLLVLAIVLITGSRSVWLALSIASLTVALPRLPRTWLRRSRLRMPAAAAVAVLLAVVVASGALSAVIQRLSSLESLDWRTDMWAPLLGAWLGDPIAGFGPGAFPWVLQLTNYFDVNSWAPRHPDNAMIQLLVEAGFLGVVSVAILGFTVLPALLRGRSRAASWAIVAFIVACIGGNPSDFNFALVVVVAWLSYALPHNAGTSESGQPPHGPIRIATVTAFGITVLAVATMHVAALSYEQARFELANGQSLRARVALDQAVALDPGMALYVRQRGTLAYTQDEFGAATADLERATELNPSDDLAWRSLALSYLADGRKEQGWTALSRALNLQRSDATNLLLSARVAGDQGRTALAVDLLAETVQSWPSIVGANGWSELLPPSIKTEDVVDAAVTRWEAGQPTPERLFDQPLWLAALGGRPELDERAVAEAVISRTLGIATISVIRCDPAAREVLDRASEDERRTPLYSDLQLRASRFAGESGEPVADTAGASSANSNLTTWNPLNENAFLSADVWGYRRLPIHWPAGDSQLPSPLGGLARWKNFPRETAHASQLDNRLPLCRIGAIGD